MIATLAAASMRGATHQTLIFHRVLSAYDPMNPSEPDARWFEGLLDALRRHFTFIPLSEAVGATASGTVGRRTLSVTFDDGYADNAVIALPVLEKLGIPATFFVATGFLDGGIMWNDVITETCRRLPAGRHVVGSAQVLDIDISDELSRFRAAVKLITAWKHLPWRERAIEVDGLSTLVDGLPSDLMMTTAQLKKLAQTPGMEIGGHTQSHPILEKLDDASARQEIEAGKQILEDMTGTKLSLFAYPNGKWEYDYSERHVEMVRDAGFTAAVTTEPGVTSASSNCFRLPRFTPWHKSYTRFVIDLARNHHGLMR